MPSERVSEINARDFAVIANYEAWEKLVGCCVLHAEQAEGRISHVQLRGNYCPLITFEFSSGHSFRLNTEILANGKTTIYLEDEQKQWVAILQAAWDKREAERLAEEQALLAARLSRERKRRSFSNYHNYSEHCVANWKLTSRQGSDVCLVGVFSAYATASNYLDGDYIDIVVLGEAHREQLQLLAIWAEVYTEGALQFIDIGNPRFFPGWAFDYPPTHYEAFDIANSRIDDAIKSAIVAGLPAQNVPRMAYAFSGNEVFEEALLTAGERRVIATIRRVRQQFGISRPFSVLLALSEFVAACQAGENGTFDAEMLKRIMFFQEDVESASSNDDDAHLDLLPFASQGDQGEGWLSFDGCPFGLIDTEEFVLTMLNALEAIWARARPDVRRFRRFQLVGANILRGDDGTGSWTTLLAYCGGFMPRPPHARCGNSPLVIGVERVCDLCKHLVCSKCGWCSENCPQLKANPIRGDHE
jgi:hypothetical protein